MTTLINFDAIQGNTLRGYGVSHPIGHFLLLVVVDGAAAREAITELVPEITSDAAWGDHPPPITSNVSFTHRGLRRLGVNEEILVRLSPEFSQGMRARAAELADPAASDLWESHWLTGVDALLTLNSIRARGSAFSDQIEAMTERLERGGFRVAAEQRVGWPQESGETVTREHFGYIDGRGQPDVEGHPRPSLMRAEHLGVPDGDGWRAVKPGEFVFGYEAEEGDSRMPGDRIPIAQPIDAGRMSEYHRFYDFMENGTYLVYRKLRQRVAAFRRFIRDQRDDSDEELFAAKLVGRWRDSTPLMLAQSRAEWEANWRGRTERIAEVNRFGYAGDPDGHIVPLGAHARRSNPRDSLPGDPTHARRRRMIRRGVPYGAPHVPWEISDAELDQIDDDRDERGLIFMSVQTSISGQFEMVHRDWLNDGDVFNQGEDRCPIVGVRVDDSANKMILPGHHPPLVPDIPEFVDLRGGDYFFRPSLPTLERIGRSDPTFVDSTTSASVDSLAL